MSKIINHTNLHSTKNLNPITTANPIRDSAPRLENTGKTKAYEFETMDDLLDCLDKGTFELQINVNDENFEKDGRLLVYMLGRYSNWGEGVIKFALKENKLTERTPNGQNLPSLFYDFVQASEPNYEERIAKCDSQKTYNAIMEHVRPHLAAVRSTYYPNFSDNLHVGKNLKMKKPKNASSTVYTADGQETTSTPFDISEHMNKKGRIMVKIGMPWWMTSNAGLDHKLMGLTYSLERKKYLTDAEKAELEAEKTRMKERKRRSEEEAHSSDIESVDAKKLRKTIRPLAA